MEITLGPVLFEWKKQEFFDFYDRVAGMDVDRVYVGEVVCQRKRRFGGLDTNDIEKIASKLARAGKKVVLSSLAVISNEEELDTARELCALGHAIEANDMSVMNMADPSKREVVAGPHITSYNAPSIDFLGGIGVRRVVMPVELPGDAIRYNAENTGVECEVFVHGKAPLAFSWRCYTSRAYGLSKANCRHDCVRDPEGMVLRTTEEDPVFTINGTSILSAGTYTLVEFTEELAASGVAALRISPQREGTGRVVDLFRKRLEGRVDAAEAMAEAVAVSPGPVTNGWYLNRAGKDRVGPAT